LLISPQVHGVGSRIGRRGEPGGANLPLDAEIPRLAVSIATIFDGTGPDFDQVKR
jgi:hypothetical protein